jgi:uncharacterized protein (DUF362 family)
MAIHILDRRAFLKGSLAAGGLAAMTSARLPGSASAAAAVGARRGARVALTAGGDGIANAFHGLQHFRDEIARAIGDRPVVIKPNNVTIDKPLCATHADCLEGILEFLKSLGKLGNAVIAESAGGGPTLDGFANYGYTRLAAKFGVKLVDLDQAGQTVVQVFDQVDFRPHPVRMSRLLLDPKSFIISAAKLKTHDTVVATLSLKNVVIGAALKDLGYRFDPKSKPGAKNDKAVCHGSGVRGLNYNLFALAQRLRPHLAVIDGQQGMEGNGPINGTAVDHRICLVSNDWLAADRLAVKLMGIEWANVGYLNFCADAGLGQADLERIEVLGEPAARHVKTYKLADNIEEQLTWKKPPQR